MPIMRYRFNWSFADLRSGWPTIESYRLEPSLFFIHPRHPFSPTRVRKTMKIFTNNGVTAQASGMLLSLLLLSLVVVEVGASPLRITQPAGEYYRVLIGDNVTIVCQMDSPEDWGDKMLEEPKWMLEINNDRDPVERRLLDTVKDKYEVTRDREHFVLNLTVWNFMYCDVGKYICTAAKDYRTTFLDSVVIGAIGPPNITVPLEHSVMQATLYRSFQLRCEFQEASDMGSTVTWYDEQGRVISNVPQSGSVPAVKDLTRVAYSALNFNSVTPTDLHLYTCLVRNQYGNASHTFEVRADPFVDIRDSRGMKLHEINVNTGERIQAHCYIANLPEKPKVAASWTLVRASGSTVTLDNKTGDVNITADIESLSSGGPQRFDAVITSHVTIARAGFEHVGNITCRVGSLWDDAMVCVSGVPKVQCSLKEIEVNSGETVDLECKATAWPVVKPDNLMWIFKGSVINSSDRYSVSTQQSGVDTLSTLTIHRATFSDTGLFNCKAGNDRGDSDSGTNVIVGQCPGGYIVGPKDQCIEERPFDVNETGIVIGVTIVTVCLLLSGLVFYIYRRRLLRKHKTSLDRVLFESEKRRNLKITFTNSASLTQTFEKVRLQSESERESLFPSDEFPRERLRFLELLGEGTFGKVMRSEALNIIGTGLWETVAVKMCKESATDTEKSDFLSELVLLRKIPKHLNIVAYYGCCTRSDPVLMIMEFAPLGDLLTYLRGRRPQKSKPETGEASTPEKPSTEPQSEQNKLQLSSKELFAFSLQIARGLKHLASNNIIHRDVAARNILLSERGVCKITDFGLARDVQGTDVYERKSKGPLPIRWMAPESLVDGCHSFASDVWSYGILVWEIVTLGASPYPGLSATQVFKFVTNANNMERPQHCTEELFELMTHCWSFSSLKRPTFTEVCARLELMLEKEGDYIDLSLFEEKNYAVLEPLFVEERL